MIADRWYEHLRSAYRPASIRVLLIGESPPEPAGAERRFFYSDKLTQHDNLFRSVALAAFGLDKVAIASIPKSNVLERMAGAGLFLIDAVDTPVNRMSQRDRQRAIQASLPDLVPCLWVWPPLRASSSARPRCIRWLPPNSVVAVLWFSTADLRRFP